MLPFLAKKIATSLSSIDRLPFLKTITPALNTVYDAAELIKRRTGQELALRCLAETEAALRPGWSEKKTAAFIRNWFADHGVTTYFHQPLVFFGDRTNYQRFSRFGDLAPTQKVLRENDVYILDAGPIVNGMACDVSMSRSVGEVPEFNAPYDLLMKIRSGLPALVAGSHDNGKAVWNEVNSMIEDQGFSAVHRESPYSFFGHRLNGTTGFPLANFLAKHGKQTFSEFLLRGLAGQLWSEVRDASLQGLWAVEPHIGCGAFGVKFEETLVVSPDYNGWLADFTK